MPSEVTVTPLEWGVFVALVVGLLAADLAISRRREQPRGLGEAALWSAGWTVVALLWNLWILLHSGPRIGAEFLTAYVVERALSLDNLFVFLVLFDFFGVPTGQRRRVLNWGILGALACRGLFIGTGTVLLRQWQWLLPLLGLLLAATGLRVAWRGSSRVEPQRNPVLKLFRRFVPLADGYRGRRFLVREGGRTLATPLLLVLVVVEATDIAFAADSLPAVLGISRHVFIIFSSNIFAVAGLRSLYPLVAEAVRRLRRPRWLQAGIGLVLVWVGAKMAIEPWLTIPVEVVLLGVLVVLVPAVAASFVAPPAAEP
jgi:tellurite resistance protein TerC